LSGKCHLRIFAEVLELKNITVTSADGAVVNTLLHDITLTFRPGEPAAVIGASGSGKSTLLKAIAGLVPVSDGRVQWKGG
jgi:ABC-type nitrate/sulfonate/bicarbonate transport system ATPase subunit